MNPLSNNAVIMLGVLSLVDGQQCGFQQKDCVCDQGPCTFNLVIEQVETFASYKVVNNMIDNLDYRRGNMGGTYYFNHNGQLKYTDLSVTGRKGCAIITNETFTDNVCSIPITVDGKTFRSVLTVNGLMPGPNLIVPEGAMVIVKITNMLSSDTTSIHWHGMHQKGTPWMDGVGGISHCPITPSSSFTYRFIASPSGTFWYHAHSGTQRTDGLFGALIVKEKLQPTGLPFPFQLNGTTEHILSLLDWQQLASEDLFTQLEGSLGFFPNTSIGEVPTAGDNWRTYTADNSEVGPIPYWSGIINGLGRHGNISYSESRLSIFTISYQNGTGDIRYRFRLIGAQSLYAYKFSISNHKLTVIAMDGYLIQPVEVDYIVIHSGERYDFALKPKSVAEANGKADYLIRAETLEVNMKGSPPYPSMNHIAEAILHYGTTRDQPTSTQYAAIAQSYGVNCTQPGNCMTFNCPFIQSSCLNCSFHTSRCKLLTDQKLLNPTPSNELPSKPSTTLFFNLGFQGDGSSSSINGRNFQLPSMPPQTQDINLSKIPVCPLGTVTCTLQECICTHVVMINDIAATELVFSSVGSGSIGNDGAGHPIHLHGHSFHVVEIGYGTYDDKSGFVTVPNPNVICSDINCTNPGWTNGADPFNNISVTSYTIRKDTIIVPAGGYVRVWIVADNPGYWFLHCHIEPHQMEGMAVLIDELPCKQASTLKLPPGIGMCGNFDGSSNTYRREITDVSIPEACKPNNSIGHQPGINLAATIGVIFCCYSLVF